MRSLLLASCALLLCGEQSTPPVGFTRKPAVTRDGRISFAVSRETDAAVYIEDAQGRVVRHLVAGVLGKNAPAPFKAGSLEQSLTWDGKDDDGNPAAGGPFTVRVGLGLNASWGGQAFTDQPGPNQIGGGGVSGLVAGPDGRVYAMGRRGGKVHWRGMTVLHAFRRDGSYEQTLKPPPSHLAEDRLKPVGAFRNGRGETTPELFNPLNMTFYPAVEMGQQMAVTPQGHLLFVVNPVGKPNEDKLSPRGHLAAIDRDGGIPYPEFAGPALDEKRSFESPALVSGADGKAVFLVGLAKSHAVFRVPLPERGPAKAWFGDADKDGDDQTHLRDPKGIASDGKGQILVADAGNNRVVTIRERDGSFVGAFPVPQPLAVAANSRTGAVYVLSGDSVLKFKDGREVARLGLESVLSISASLFQAYAKNMRRCIAVDSSAEPAILWIGRNSGPRPLLRCEDQGDKFSVPQPAGCSESPEYWNLSSEPAARRLVSCRVEPAKVGGQWAKDLQILDEDTGKVRTVRPRPTYTHQGTLYRLGPGGQIFSMSVLASIARHDPNGAFLPYATVADKASTNAQQQRGTNDGLMENTPNGSSGWTRDFSVARNGDVYVHHRIGTGGSLVRIDRLSGKTGKFDKTVISQATRNALGPRVDPQGNIYLAECLKPGGVTVPSAFDGRLGPVQKDIYAMQYGSLVKFGPDGGAIEWPVPEAQSIPKWELPGKKETVPGNWYMNLFAGKPVLTDATVRGAEWVHGGFSKIGRPYCFCLSIDFDVDDFGRTFYPDLLQYRVGVVDTNGNDITTFGGYGNQDCCGPESYVVDPRDGFLRPRRPGDPKDLASPSAKPEIGFAWIVGLAVTDRNAYVADEVNRRVLRVKLGYAVEERATIP